MSRQPSASIGGIQVLRATTYFVSILVVSASALLAFVASTLPDATRIALAAFGLIIAVVLVLLVHQPIGLVTASSAILAALAFILPATLVHEKSRGGLAAGRSLPATPG
jgi:hypothetical protein